MNFQNFLIQKNTTQENFPRLLKEWRNREAPDTGPFHFFWSGMFSQWYISEFSVNGIKYNCAEQYMMSQKALLFNDHYNYNEIIKSNQPSTQKSLGRRVKNFDLQKWNSCCMEIVCQGNYAKFSQNIPLKNSLLETDGFYLVEASPYDKIWGVGLKEDDPLIKNKKNWKGQNLLGQCLNKVREEIILEDYFNNEYISYLRISNES